MSNKSTTSEGPAPPPPPPNTETTIGSDSTLDTASDEANLTKYKKQGVWLSSDMSHAMKMERFGPHLSKLTKRQPQLFPGYASSEASTIRLKLPGPPDFVSSGPSGYASSVLSLPPAPPNSLAAGSVGNYASSLRSEPISPPLSVAPGAPGAALGSQYPSIVLTPKRVLPVREKNVSARSGAPTDAVAAEDGVFEHSDWREDAISSMQNAVRQVVRLAVDDYQKEPSKTPVQYYNECIDRVFRDQTLFQAFLDIGFSWPLESEKAEADSVEDMAGI